MKKITTLIFIAILSLVLISCKKDNIVEGKVLFKDVIEELCEIYAEGDSKDNVTKDLNLKTKTTKLDDVVITWKSDTPEVISDEGVVTPHKSDINVILTLNLEKGEVIFKKTFSLSVIALEKEEEEEKIAQAIIDELLQIYAEGDSKDNVTKDLIFKLTSSKSDDIEASWTSSNPEIVSDEGVVVRGETNQLVTINLTINKGNIEKKETLEVTIIALEKEDEYQIVQYTETFDGINLDKGTYKSVEYRGINNINWNVVHARASGDYPIDDDGIMLSGANGDEDVFSSLSATFPDGIIDFTFDYMKAFTGKDVRNYVVEITNNNITKEIELPAFGEGSGKELEVYKYVYEGQELEGEVTVKIAGSGGPKNKQATFDNFTWRQYELIPEGQIRHEVSFDTTGGKYLDPVKIIDGKTLGFVPIPTRDGYDFVEWYLGDSLFDETTQITEDITLTAKWTTSKNTVTVDLGYIEVDNVTYYEIEQNEPFNEPNAPTRDGYQFIGWYQFFRGSDNHNQYDFTKKVSEDIRIIAKWEKTKADPIYTRDDDELTQYYNPIKDKTGEELVLALRDLLTTTHKPVNYGEARYSLEEADRHPHDSTKVLGIYDRAMYVGPWNHPNWEREHVWPNSKLGVARANNNTINQASDLHNLRAILPVVNQRRGNRYFVNPTATLYSPVGHIVGDGIYYPGDEDIGDVARIFLYMSVRYEVLKLTDDHNLLRLGDAQKNNNTPESAYMGTLSLLYEWHLADPVDDFEIRRNNIIYDDQKNRNPFIDHPELFEEVFDYFIDLDTNRSSSTVSFVVDDTYVVHIDYTFFKKEKENILVA